MTSPQLLITGGTVLVGPALTGAFERADVLVEDGAITAIGPDLDSPGAETVDATGTFVLPGFVDAHTHLWEATMRGLTSDWDLLDFAWGVRFNHTALHTPDDVYAGVFGGARAALDGGTTTVLDHAHCIVTPAHADAALQGLADSGLRAIWAYGLTDVPTPTPTFTAPGQRWADLRRLRAAHSDGTITLGLAANDLLNVPWETTVQEYRLARELDLLLTAHLNTSSGPQRVPEVLLLDHDGLLGPRQVYSHGNASDDREMTLLAGAGSALASAPESEAQMGIGHPVFARARAAGVRVGLGSDLQANNSPDAFAQMRLARHLENARANQSLLDRAGLAGLRGVAVTTREALHLATQGGAEALGLADRIGSLQPGKQADIILVRNDSARQRPIVDPFATIVEASSPGDVDTVLVGGKVLKRHGALTDGQADKAVQLAESTWSALSARMAERGGPKPPRPDGMLEQAAATVVGNLPSWFTV